MLHQISASGFNMVTENFIFRVQDVSLQHILQTGSCHSTSALSVMEKKKKSHHFNSEALHSANVAVLDTTAKCSFPFKAGQLGKGASFNTNNLQAACSSCTSKVQSRGRNENALKSHLELKVTQMSTRSFLFLCLSITAVPWERGEDSNSPGCSSHPKDCS